MGHKILLADDSITIQKVIELTFSDEDFELHTVGNGQKAMDEIRAIMPDIVLCDIIMPEKNGYEVCEFIKSAADLKHIPVLLLTGAFEPFDQERARAAGCEGFLAKPFEPQTLISKVKELLANAAPSAAAAPAPAPAAPEPMAPSFPETMAGSEETAFAPPSTPGAPASAAGPQVTATPTPPPPQNPSDAGGLNEGFAVEAGERELAMGPSDRTVLLPGSESSEPAGPTPIASDDIWSDVGGATTAPSAPASPQPPGEDDSATVFMSPPPMATEDEAIDAEDMTMMNLGGADPDATWQMPGTESSPEPAPTPVSPAEGDFGGFSDFASAEPEAPPPMDMTPPSPPTVEPEPIPPVDTGSTIDQTVEAPPFQPPGPSPVANQPPVVQPPPAPTPTPKPAPTPPPVEPAAESPFEPVEPFSEEPVMAASPEPIPAPTPPRPSAPATSGPVDDDLVEQVAQRVVDKLSQKVIQEIAWEVVPDLAEGLIQREIEALKAKIPK